MYSKSDYSLDGKHDLEHDSRKEKWGRWGWRISARGEIGVTIWWKFKPRVFKEKTRKLI